MATSDPKPEGNKKDRNYYMPLYKAARKGDWESARLFFDHDPDAVTEVVTTSSKTALHISALAGHEQFVVKLVELMPPEALARQCGNKFTGLHEAAISGITNAAKAMVNKDPNLPQVYSANGWTPLVLAAFYEQEEMVKYLLTVTTAHEHPYPFSGSSGAQLLTYSAAAGFYDVCVYLLRRYPQLATTKDMFGDTVLKVMAKKPDAFYSGCRLGSWQRFIYPYVPVELDDALHDSIIKKEDPTEPAAKVTQVPVWIQFLKTLFLVPGIKKVRDSKLSHLQAVELVKLSCAQILTMKYEEILSFLTNSSIVNIGAEFGVYELVKECVVSFPDIINIVFWGAGTIFHIAISNRREKVFDLIHGIKEEKKVLLGKKVGDGNILHLAAKLAPSPQLDSVSGAALQMQRELQWFKEVEKIMLPTWKELTKKKDENSSAKNEDGKTAYVVFTEDHKELVEKGEKWMKDTAQSCMVVATLITTVVFTAAFTVPGGNNSETGIPIFLKEKAFMIFMISDAMSLFSSITSTLMFLSILTARYAEEDFLRSLPKRLIFGLAALFFSIATMIIAFSATLFIVLNHAWIWVSIPITLLACFPVALFMWLQLPLFVEMVLSTFGRGIFRREKITYF